MSTASILDDAQAPPWERWPWPDRSRATIPYWLYTSREVLERERERLFPDNWLYVGLEAELPGPGDYIRSWAGDIPVMVTRDRRDGTIACVVNRCGHRGVEFVQDAHGSVSSFTCPYHQWSYSCRGDLTGIPHFRGANGCPGMPGDFDRSERGLRRLHVALHNGAIFAGLEPIQSLEDWLGPKMLGWFDQTLNGRELQILGRHVQRIDGNWKLYTADNLRDSWHGGLLHYFFRAFALASAAQPGAVEVSDDGRHSVLIHYRGEQPAAGNGGIPSSRLTLQEPRILELWPEREGPSTTMLAVGPTMVLGRQLNSFNIRQVVPRGPHQFDLVWTFFTYAGDSAEMIRHRIDQSCLQGVAGYISIDDAYMFGAAQAGMMGAPGEHAVIEMGGRGTGDAATVATETALRAWYDYYRDVMGF